MSTRFLKRLISIASAITTCIGVSLSVAAESGLRNPNQEETLSVEACEILASLGYSDARIDSLRTSSKLADSFIVYTIHEQAVVGHTYQIKTSISFDDAYIDYCGTRIGNASSQSTDTNGLGWENVTTNNTFTATSTTHAFSALKFFWSDNSYDVEDVLNDPIITFAYDSTAPTYIPQNTYNTVFTSSKIGLGDMNGNGIVNQSDLNIIVAVVADSYTGTLTVEEKLAGDVNGNGIIDVNDLNAILHWMNATSGTPAWSYI